MLTITTIRRAVSCRRDVLLVVAVAWMLAAAAPASASAKQRPHRMTFEFASVVAVDYLAKRGVTLPCRPRQHLYTDAEEAALQEEYRAAGITAEGERVDMTADVETCTVNVTLDLDWYRTEPGYKWIYCQKIVHEFGHLAGLSHPTPETPGLPIMDYEQNVVPWGCDHPLKFRRRHR